MVIQFYNRKSKSYEIEKVAGEGYLHWIYSSPIGMGFLEMIVKKKLFSKLYGCYCDSTLSRKKVNKFIEDFNIDMSLCQNNKFSSFNDFFIRQLNQEARPICKEENILISPCDGKILTYKDINIDNLVQVKGITYKLSELINDESIISKYQKGTCMIFRLCPTDYHRFHFIDKGTCSETKKIKGNYYSVNPIALNNVPKLFCQNKREWSILHSTNFKDILYIEVGATCVGSIIQTYTPSIPVNKGDEKGYFKFGGSTVILFFEKDSIIVDEDILAQSKLGHESSVLLGEQIAVKKY